MTTAELLTDQIRRTREWTLLLIDDVEGDDWFFQPADGVQHAMWLCGHLACAQELLLFQRCIDRPTLDPEFMAHFPIGAAVKSGTAHTWPAPQTVLATMAEMQKRTEDVVIELDDALLAEPAFGKDGAKHPHYDTKAGAISHLIRHEGFHCGQLATLRRLMGKSFLR